MRTFSTCTTVEKSLPSGEKVRYEIRLKDLEESISDAGINYLLERAHTAIDMSLSHLKERLAGQMSDRPRVMDFEAIETVDTSLFSSPTPTPASSVPSGTVSPATGTQTGDQSPTPEERRAELVASLLGKPEPDPVIPEDIDTRTEDQKRSAYGHFYEGGHIPAEAWNEPYTKTGGESGHGQCKALNTLLQDRGFKNEQRHQAVFYLRAGMTGNREPVGTLDVLTKAEAMLLIDWLESAPRSAMDQLTADVNRYEPSFDDEDPFVNVGTDPMKNKRNK